MLPRQPLRFLLADDPGAGRTIMAGLPIKSWWRAATSSAALSRAGQRDGSTKNPHRK
jgi:hypothetical protein